MQLKQKLQMHRVWKKLKHSYTPLKIVHTFVDIFVVKIVLCEKKVAAAAASHLSKLCAYLLVEILLLYGVVQLHCAQVVCGAFCHKENIQFFT